MQDRIEEARLQDNIIKQMRTEFGIIDTNNDQVITKEELHYFFMTEKVGTCRLVLKKLMGLLLVLLTLTLLMCASNSKCLMKRCEVKW